MLQKVLHTVQGTRAQARLFRPLVTTSKGQKSLPVRDCAFVADPTCESASSTRHWLKAVVGPSTVRKPLPGPCGGRRSKKTLPELPFPLSLALFAVVPGGFTTKASLSCLCFENVHVHGKVRRLVFTLHLGASCLATMRPQQSPFSSIWLHFGTPILCAPKPILNLFPGPEKSNSNHVNK